MKITKRVEWDSAHRLLGHGKCGTLHGHRYIGLVTVLQDRAADMVMDFAEVDRIVSEVVKKGFDHTTLVWLKDHELLSFCERQTKLKDCKNPYTFEGQTTVENIARELYGRLARAFERAGVVLDTVSVFETPTSTATYSGEEETDA